jgi:hypothetical protein
MIGKREFKQMLAAVNRLWGQLATGPTGVADQSVWRINCPISPPPAKASIVPDEPGIFVSI